MGIFRNMHFLLLCYQMCFLADLFSSMLGGNGIRFQRLFIKAYDGVVTAKLPFNYLQVYLFLR